MEETKFCKWCGEKIAMDAEICPKCGRRVEAAPTTTAPQVIVNNTNQNTNTNVSTNTNNNNTDTEINSCNEFEEVSSFDGDSDMFGDMPFSL